MSSTFKVRIGPSSSSRLRHCLHSLVISFVFLGHLVFVISPPSSRLRPCLHSFVISFSSAPLFFRHLVFIAWSSRLRHLVSVPWSSRLRHLVFVSVISSLFLRQLVFVISSLSAPSLPRLRHLNNGSVLFSSFRRAPVRLFVRWTFLRNVLKLKKAIKSGLNEEGVKGLERSYLYRFVEFVRRRRAFVFRCILKRFHEPSGKRI